MTTDQQRRLLCEAIKYQSLGYIVGLTQDKSLVQRFTGLDEVGSKDWNGISLLLKDMVCVDFDSCYSLDVGWGRELPPTWKEKSPRGFHLFYRVDFNKKFTSKIKWKKDIDLLTNSSPKNIFYGEGPKSEWAGHVLVSPTPGYQKIYPEQIPKLDQLIDAPVWIIDELLKSETVLY